MIEGLAEEEGQEEEEGGTRRGGTGRGGGTIIGGCRFAKNNYLNLVAFGLKQSYGISCQAIALGTSAKVRLLVNSDWESIDVGFTSRNE